MNWPLDDPQRTPDACDDACEARLYVDPTFDRFHCKPDVFKCSCGLVWEHVCDEAEGCFWMLTDGHVSDDDE